MQQKYWMHSSLIMSWIPWTESFREQSKNKGEDDQPRLRNPDFGCLEALGQRYYISKNSNVRITVFTIM